MFNIPINSDIVFLDIEADHKHDKLLQFGAIKFKVEKPFKLIDIQILEEVFLTM